MINLVTRGDDIGMCESANRGVLDAFRNGCMRNISVMATGPALAHAAELLAKVPGLCVGMHVALNCEWVHPRWGNVLPAARAPSLCKPDGTQFETPNMLHDRGFSVDEAMAEIAAQLARIRAHGFHVSYVDQHMGVGWIQGLRQPLTEFCNREGLIDGDALVHGIPGKGDPLDRLADAPGGTYVLVGHPCLPEADLMDFVLPGQQRGDTARDRDRQRLMFSDARLMARIAAGRVRPISYVEAAAKAAKA